MCRFFLLGMRFLNMILSNKIIHKLVSCSNQPASIINKILIFKAVQNTLRYNRYTYAVGIGIRLE